MSAISAAEHTLQNEGVVRAMRRNRLHGLKDGIALVAGILSLGVPVGSSSTGKTKKPKFEKKKRGRNQHRANEENASPTNQRRRR